MQTLQKIPEDPLARFENIYNALAAERRWWRDASPLRFSAMGAITCSGSPDKVAASIRQITENLRAEGGLLGRLSRSLQFIIAAMLLGQSDTARSFLTEVKRVRAMFRKEGIRRAAIYETMAILVLRLQAKKNPIDLKNVKKLKDLYEEMKKHHWWLTGPEDLPTCAILCDQNVP